MREKRRTGDDQMNAKSTEELIHEIEKSGCMLMREIDALKSAKEKTR